jgi:murein DD-endopeptidase MepM/ murein hydrolase activator NlpD
LLVIGVVAAAFFAAPRLEGSPPRIEAPEVHALGRAPRTLAVALSDEGSGLRSASARLVHAGGESVIAERAFAGDLLTGGGREERAATLEIALDAAALGLAEGDARLVIGARDWSWRGWLGGNTGELAIPLRIDLRAPRVQVETGLTWVRRGGAGVVVYRLDEAAAEDGVRVGEAFFQGVAFPGGGPERRVALYAIPVDAPAEPAPRVIARDDAGNETAAPWPTRILERQFPDSTIRLSSSFLEGVAAPLAANNGLAASDPVEAFRLVNEELRARSEARIREILAQPSAERHFAGAFAQLANSKVTSGFAEHRTYLLDERPVSRAVHYGFDLAATAATPVTAAAAGVVRHAGELGIYGDTVIVDHGLGLASLYAHLSRVDAEPGRRVEQGEAVGLSGATGLAGGDHLHFAVLVGGSYVDPLEWWDERWVREHVESELARSNELASR